MIVQGKQNKGLLYLIPTIISNNTETNVLPRQIIDTIKNLKYYLVENQRSARRFFKRVLPEIKLDEIKISVLDKKTKREDIKVLISPLLNGDDLGILSDSGCPGIADPGSLVVEKAHEMEIKVIPLVGPSSILLSIMASGFNGQHFTFHGYLPIEDNLLKQKLKQIETEIFKSGAAQIFIETPYRNQRLLKALTTHLNNNVKLCIASNLTGKNEYIKTMSISKWREATIEFHKVPAVFLLGK